MEVRADGAGQAVDAGGNGLILVASPDIHVLMYVASRVMDAGAVSFAAGGADLRRVIDSGSVKAALVDPAILSADDKLFADLGLCGVPVVWLRQPLAGHCMATLEAFGVRTVPAPARLARLVGSIRRFLRWPRCCDSRCPAACRTPLEGLHLAF